MATKIIGRIVALISLIAWPLPVAVIVVGQPPGPGSRGVDIDVYSGLTIDLLAGCFSVDQARRKTCGTQCVGHQHRNGHRPNAAGYRCHRLGDFTHVVEINVASQAHFEFAINGFLNAVDTDIYNDRTRFNPVGLDHVGSSTAATMMSAAATTPGKSFVRL